MGTDQLKTDSVRARKVTVVWKHPSFYIKQKGLERVLKLQGSDMAAYGHEHKGNESGGDDI